MRKVSQHLPHTFRFIAFFLLGAFSTAMILALVVYAGTRYHFQDRIFPGIAVAGIDLSDLTKTQAETKLSEISVPSQIEIASISATSSDVGLVPNTSLMAERAFSVGRQNQNPYYNLLQIYSAWNGEINLPKEVSIDETALKTLLKPYANDINKPAVDAVFEFSKDAGPDQKGRVKAFTPSINGVAVDYEKIKSEIILQSKQASTNISVPLFTKILTPSIQTSAAEKYGLRDILGTGESYFYDSIPGRVYNIGLGTEKINGSLIAPGAEFSFNNSIGTISALFGFQKAYAIIKNKTVLDDGGGVCQVSTTIYRAALNAGLPITERSAHAYRVGFYEQGGFKPGLDATVYPPDPDFRFKNDTGHWLLLQAAFDETNKKLTFQIFGTDDGRKTQLEGPVILSQTPPPEPIYEDDPNLPTGQEKQVDTAHFGAKTSFTRTVTRNGETLIKETVVSNYIPWPARILRGTKT